MEPNTVKVRQTERFIAENPTDLVLTRNTRASDGAGGFTTSPTPLSSQVVRIVQQRTSAAVERRNISGEVVNPSVTLVCLPSVNVQRGDTFTWQGLSAEVVWRTDLGYVVHAEVVI